MLFIGPTTCGKTTIAKYTAKTYFNARRNVYVFDPKASSGWCAHRENKFCRPENFIAAIPKMHDGIAIIDESPIFFDDTEHKKIITNFVEVGRHQGLVIALIAQDYMAIAKRVRSNAGIVHCFNQNVTCAKRLKFDYPKIIDVTTLPPYHYVSVSAFDCSPVYITPR